MSDETAKTYTFHNVDLGSTSQRHASIITEFHGSDLVAVTVGGVSVDPHTWKPLLESLTEP